MPALPTILDYLSAVQSPRISFTDPLLKTCEVAQDPLGMPRVSSGGFALTYQLFRKATGQKWAVRCFKAFIPDRQERYAAISKYIEQFPQDFFVPITYDPGGIRINNGVYP